MSSSLPDFATIESDFAFLDDWEERYRYIIDLGSQLTDLPAEMRTEETRVRGCASQVWITLDVGPDGRMTLCGDSDAQIVRGLIAIVLSLYQGKTAAEIASVDPDAALAALDLSGHITPQRANGVASMIERIRKLAAENAATSSGVT